MDRAERRYVRNVGKYWQQVGKESAGFSDWHGAHDGGELSDAMVGRCRH
jgi:hypothetical protein